MTLEEMRALLAGTAADQADLVDCRGEWPFSAVRMSRGARSLLADQLTLTYGEGFLRYHLGDAFYEGADLALYCPHGTVRVVVDDTLPDGEWRLE